MYGEIDDKLVKNINIQDLKAGNQKVFETLFVELYAPLCRYACSILLDEDDAKDMVQKTFYKLWDGREDIEIHTSIKSYLYRMVHNNCLNHIKHFQTHDEHIGTLLYETKAAANDVEETVALNELEQEIARAINVLPERCREVFRLSRMQQLSYAEIAKKLNISPNTVETQIVKALRILRSELAEFYTN